MVSKPVLLHKNHGATRLLAGQRHGAEGRRVARIRESTRIGGKEGPTLMQKDRLATLTMDIVVNYPTKRTALDAVRSRLSPWAQAEWDRARQGVSIA